jgi:hypothetical protein
LTLGGAIGSVCNGSSRILWATIQDYLGFNTVYFMIMLIQLVVSVVIVNVRSSPVSYIICLAFAFLCEGGHFAVFPAAGAKIFGLQHGGLIFTFMFICVPLSSLTGFFLVELGGKDPNFIKKILAISTALTVLNLCLLFVFDEGEMELDENGKVKP